VRPTPLVSILLPAYNAAHFLRPCLRSVQRQTEARWECIVVDDGSEDDTAACAGSFAAVDQRFTLVQRPHAGLVTTLNHGMRRCRGRYIARLDGDDLMHRDRLRAQIEALERDPQLVGVGCHVRLFPRSGLRDGRRAYERWLNRIDTSQRLRTEAFVECPIAHPTLVIRAERLRAFGYRDCGWPEDYDLVLRLLGSGAKLGVVPRRLLLWRDTPARLSRTAARYSLDRFTACKAAFLAAGFLSGGETYVLWGYGETGQALRRALLVHGKRPAYIVEVHPGRLGQVIHGAPVIAPDRLPHIPRLPVIASVSGEEPRRQIRAAMMAFGLRELDDFVCAA
jgi:glycosyltransferase involved in cell wall biosynthesis